MIRSRHPKNPVAGHAPPTDEDVTLRMLEHVPHVQVTGDVGRRQQDRKGLAVQALVFGVCGRSSGCGLGEELLAHPVFGPVIFNGGGVVGFGQVVRHVFLGRVPDGLRKTLLLQGFCARSNT